MKKRNLLWIFGLLIAVVSVLTSCKAVNKVIGKEEDDEPLPEGTIAETYDVNYIIGDSIVFTEVVSKDRKAPNKTAPLKEGYDFVGWFTTENLDVAYDFNTGVTGELSLYGKYDVHVDVPQDVFFKVTFVVNGGSEVAQRTVKEGNKCTKPEDPTREGYTFIGWYTTEELKFEFDFESAITADTSVYAKWNNNENPLVIVKYSTAEGSQVADSTYSKGDIPTAPENPTLEGYYFDGWYLNDTYTVKYTFENELTSNITLYAHWVQFTIRFRDVAVNSLNFVDPIEKVVEIPKELPTPTKDGYTFEGWYSNGSYADMYKAEAGQALTSDIVLIAKWKEILKLTVTFNTVGGNTIEPLEDVNRLPDLLPTPVKAGYKFEGWYTNNSLAEQYKAVAGAALTANIELTAKWTAVVTYEIKYDSQGGTTVATVTGATNLPETLPTPTKEGYNFEGWFTDKALSKQAVAGAELTANIELTAKWTAVVTYEIKFDSQGGSGVETLTGLTTIPATLPIPEKEGYTFEGWYTDKALVNKVVEGTELTANIELTAKWTAA